MRPVTNNNISEVYCVNCGKMENQKLREYREVASSWLHSQSLMFPEEKRMSCKADSLIWLSTLGGGHHYFFGALCIGLRNSMSK